MQSSLSTALPTAWWVAGQGMRHDRQDLTTTEIHREFRLDERPDSAVADLQGNLVTTMQAGAVAGALVSSWFADKWGRKPALLAVAITGFIGGLMQAFSYGIYSVFYIGR